MPESISVHSPRYEGLQILRILAAFLVLVTHSTFYAAERLGGVPVWYRGAGGVDLFFVVSGFVMISSSSRLFGDPDGWKVFAERRITRIVPIYWLITSAKVFMMILAARFVLHAHLNLAKTVMSYFFLPTYNVDGEIRPTDLQRRRRDSTGFGCGLDVEF